MAVGVGDDVAELLADEGGVFEIMACRDQVLPTRPFLRRNQSYPNLIQHGLVYRIEPNRASRHAEKSDRFTLQMSRAKY